MISRVIIEFQKACSVKDVYREKPAAISMRVFSGWNFDVKNFLIEITETV